MHPEAKARQIIDKKLTDSGWLLQDYKSEFNPAASLGVAVREFPTDSGPVDYMLFSVCDKLEQTIDQTLALSASLRQSILKKAFEGRLVPQDLNDEPAEKLLERIKAEKAAILAKQKQTRKRGRK